MFRINFIPVLASTSNLNLDLDGPSKNFTTRPTLHDESHSSSMETTLDSPLCSCVALYLSPDTSLLLLSTQTSPALATPQYFKETVFHYDTKEFGTTGHWDVRHPEDRMSVPDVRLVILRSFTISVVRTDILIVACSLTPRTQARTSKRRIEDTL